MTSRAKRLALILGVVVLVAVVAGSVMAPALRAAPKAKTDFTITTKEESSTGGSLGTFTAQGAIQDSGVADGGDDPPPLVLIGEKGTMGIDIEYDPSEPGSMKRTGTFTIVKPADGQYADLVGLRGAYAERFSGHSGKDPLAAGASGRHPTAPTSTIHRTLKGSI